MDVQRLEGLICTQAVIRPALEAEEGKDGFLLVERSQRWTQPITNNTTLHSSASQLLLLHPVMAAGLTQRDREIQNNANINNIMQITK